MITRIVRMSFQPEKVEEFLGMFRSVYPHIRFFEGCTFLELHRDASDSNVFYTMSYWGSEEDLHRYRHSDLFKTVWAQTRSYFLDKPQAWSLERVVANLSAPPPSIG